jgi:hypothetical protein
MYVYVYFNITLKCRSFQIGHEKLYVPWLYVINRKSPEVPMIDFNLVRSSLYDAIVIISLSGKY